MPRLFGGLHKRRGSAHPAARYNDYFRTTAVRLYYRDHWTQAQIAERLGCHRQSVARWLHQHAEAVARSPKNRLPS